MAIPFATVMQALSYWNNATKMVGSIKNALESGHPEDVLAALLHIGGGEDTVGKQLEDLEKAVREAIDDQTGELKRFEHLSKLQDVRTEGFNTLKTLRNADADHDGLQQSMETAFSKLRIVINDIGEDSFTPDLVTAATYAVSSALAARIAQAEVTEYGAWAKNSVKDDIAWGLDFLDGAQELMRKSFDIAVDIDKFYSDEGGPAFEPIFHELMFGQVARYKVGVTYNISSDEIDLPSTGLPSIQQSELFDDDGGTFSAGLTYWSDEWHTYDDWRERGDGSIWTLYDVPSHATVVDGTGEFREVNGFDFEAMTAFWTRAAQDSLLSMADIDPTKNFMEADIREFGVLSEGEQIDGSEMGDVVTHLGAENFDGAVSESTNRPDGGDYMDGKAGDDLILGGLGDDVLVGGEGSDTLVGGEGNDVLIGSKGRQSVDDDDTVMDHFVFMDREGVDRIVDYTWHDRIVLVEEAFPELDGSLDNGDVHFGSRGSEGAETAKIILDGEGLYIKAKDAPVRDAQKFAEILDEQDFFSHQNFELISAEEAGDFVAPEVEEPMVSRPNLPPMPHPGNGEDNGSVFDVIDDMLGNVAPEETSIGDLFGL
jgi:hypothetical protein